ncbi:Retrotransposon gag protein [Corchorus olitorius]|uniref:Retrotransposon gag protein n=1 Tax=Corchorus olitorius TaxID=93759 RepID=A0A1R3JJ38_9ROSI|nr:Retrotransposon gag protein [Corchorus olitorius]
MELMFQKIEVSVSTSQGSNQCSSIVEFPHSSTKDGSETTRVFTKHSKLECPRFNGDDFIGWRSKIEQFFLADKTAELDKIQLVMMHLEGRALQWHLHYLHNLGNPESVPWTQYVAAMRSRFSSTKYFDALAELVMLRQTGTVDEYYDDFEKLLNLIDLKDHQDLSIFVTNIKPELSREVRKDRPVDLDSAVNLAREIKSLYLSPSQKGNTSSLSAPTATSLNTCPNFKPNNPTQTNRNTKMPTREERDDRRKKGSCMWCASKYAPCHKCGVKSNLYQILMEDTGDPTTDSKGLAECLEFDEDTSELTNEKENPPIITLHAVLGTAGPQTMRVMGKIKNQLVMILMDTGSTHNFLDISMAKRLGCIFQPIKNVELTVANGEGLTCIDICKALKLEVQGLV